MKIQIDALRPLAPLTVGEQRNNVLERMWQEVVAKRDSVAPLPRPRDENDPARVRYSLD